MAKVKKEDILELSTAELMERVKDEKETLLKLKFNHTVSPIENPNLLKDTKRNIARFLTELKQRESRDGNTEAPAATKEVKEIKEEKKEKEAEAKTEDK